MDFAVKADHRVKLKKKRKDLVPRPSLISGKTLEHESDGYTSCYWCSR